MAEEDLKQTSTAMYLCHRIVGTEKAVETKRMLNATNDIFASRCHAFITSGSFGEGIEMRGSDIDIMLVQREFHVNETNTDIQFNAMDTYVQIITEDTKPGFVKLLLLRKGLSHMLFNICVEHKGNQYLSNVLFKSSFSKFCNLMNHLGSEHIHGPCISDKDETIDIAFCLHSEIWITQANQWIYRPNPSWPSSDVKRKIVEHGALFVPIGVKGSQNEEVEWRLSFSVGEKLLIHSFNHTQLLSYALMKILLKDVINMNRDCDGLLCSYHIKNILFWVSEEMILSEWTPDNLLSCFMQCLRRLIYCVHYSVCPHYFIPDNNMFESKIEGSARDNLLYCLTSLLGMDYHCVLLSQQLQFFHNSASSPILNESKLFVDYIDQMVKSRTLLMSGTELRFAKAVQVSVGSKYFVEKFSESCSRIAEMIHVFSRANKDVYRRYRTVQCYLLQGLYEDAVSGWLKLAALFYQTKEYIKALKILSYALSKCTQDKIYGRIELSPFHCHLFQSEPVRSLGLLGIMRIFRVKLVTFIPFCVLIPEELNFLVEEDNLFLPPVVFAHFLSFLCHYHLGDVKRYTDSIQDLQITISEAFFISKRAYQGSAYLCLGIAFHLVGDIEAARQSFQTAVRLESVPAKKLHKKLKRK